MLKDSSTHLDQFLDCLPTVCPNELQCLWSPCATKWERHLPCSKVGRGAPTLLQSRGRAVTHCPPHSTNSCIPASNGPPLDRLTLTFITFPSLLWLPALTLSFPALALLLFALNLSYQDFMSFPVWPCLVRPCPSLPGACLTILSCPLPTLP